MTYEGIKSIILTFLIVLSGTLTWAIWTYQPNYESIQKNNVVNPVALSEARELKKIVKPDQVVFHIDDQHFGTVDSTYIDKLITSMGKWNLYDIKNNNRRNEGNGEMLNGNGKVEIIFPDEVPVTLYNKVLNFEETDIPRFSFDRIIINAQSEENQEGTIYFASSNSEQIYISSFSPQHLNDFINQFYKQANKLNLYFPYETANKAKYLPVQETEMVRYRYYPNPLDSDKFKDALFNDPSFVQRSPVEDGEEFTDDTSRMAVNYGTNMIYYINPTNESEVTIGTNDILKKSIDFVDGHSGWTDAYRYSYKDDLNRQVIFRLYSSDGYPIFNPFGMSEIYQMWSQNEINQYIRPRFNLELPLQPDMNTVTVPSGQTALDFIQASPNFNPDLFEDITLGYNMISDPKDSSLILLEPAWFYLYQNNWQQITFEGGINNGLE
ncbi:YycH family regulatory protein [Mesobacillus harenae]|uniref:YycH family regulatory protein n=1 Tax=Mesobacillus harenae TaxID=2213203 RepID=UPI0015810ED0|nr:two-component system activity regulator YycH [Mesobacillus harenae]